MSAAAFFWLFGLAMTLPCILQGVWVSLTDRRRRQEEEAKMVN